MFTGDRQHVMTSVSGYDRKGNKIGTAVYREELENWVVDAGPKRLLCGTLTQAMATLKEFGAVCFME